MSTCREKLDDCEVCGENKAKYTCPKCEVRSCSLTCSNIHKKELDCDGIRDKTKYLPIQSISELHVASDYCLLQEAGRCVDKCNRDPLKHCATLNNLLPIFLRKLKHAAFKRGVILEFMPRSFSKNQENTTRFMWRKNELLWRIDWIFPQGENIKWTTSKASERAQLSVLLENVLEPQIKADEDPDLSKTKSSLRKKLQVYRSAGLNGIKILMKAEKVPKSKSKFFELDLNLTLRENLEQKRIIEYPIFYVILSQNAEMYEIIHPDKTECSLRHRSKFKPKQNNRPQNPQEKEEIQSINFLFHTEFSDSEDERGKIEKEKNAKTQGRKRKFNRFQKGQKTDAEIKDSANKFRNIKVVSEVVKRKIEENVQSPDIKFLELKSDNPEKQDLPISDLNKFHITDSEDEGPEETPIQRLLIDDNEIENKNPSADISKKENEDTNKKEENSAAIKSIAMNYFSAYMSDSEEEVIPDNSNSGNSGLQIPDYNVLVKMNQ